MIDSKKIVIPIVNRTNYSKLCSILNYLKEEPALEIKIILTSGAAVKELSTIEDDLINDNHSDITTIDSCLHNDTHGAMVKNIGMSMIQYSTFLEREKPDLVLVVGDRFDMLAYASASAIQNIPVAHIQGGERSGTIDDKIRFSITTLSDYHFPSSLESITRVLGCGANPHKVYDFGCPAVEHIANVGNDTQFSIDDLKKYSKRSLQGLRNSKGYMLVQVHPNTTESEDVDMEELLLALNEIDLPSIILYPNIDATNREIIDVMRKYKDVNKFYYYKHFSLPIFVGLIKNCKCFIGNSSSIIRESSLFGIPAINLGKRQMSREHNSNVHTCDFDKNEILNLYNDIKDKSFDNNNVYYKKDCSKNISKKLLEILDE